MHDSRLSMHAQQLSVHSTCSGIDLAFSNDKVRIRMDTANMRVMVPKKKCVVRKNIKPRESDGAQDSLKCLCDIQRFGSFGYTCRRNSQFRIFDASFSIVFSHLRKAHNIAWTLTVVRQYFSGVFLLG